MIDILEEMKNEMWDVKKHYKIYINLMVKMALDKIASPDLLHLS